MTLEVILSLAKPAPLRDSPALAKLKAEWVTAANLRPDTEDISLSFKRYTTG